MPVARELVTSCLDPSATRRMVHLDSSVKSRSIQERGPHVIRRGLDVDGVSQDQLSSLGFCMNTTADLSPSGASLVHNGRALGTSVRRTVS